METYLKIKDIKLWARVGVLEQERDLGQLFSLDVFYGLILKIVLKMMILKVQLIIRN